MSFMNFQFSIVYILKTTVCIQLLTDFPKRGKLLMKYSKHFTNNILSEKPVISSLSDILDDIKI